MGKTKISWTNDTWNPIRGCSRVSEGCRHCYAEKMAYRYSGPGLPYEGLAVLRNGEAGWTGEVKFVEEHLLDPIRKKKPRMWFVNSMSDLFHENVTDEQRDRIFAVMALCPQHTFQVLTKRPERMLNYCSAVTEDRFRPLVYKGEGPRITQFKWPLLNVWLGVSVENQKTAEERIPLLLQTPAAVRFISAEPLLGPLYIRQWIGLEGKPGATKLDWVIVGGESGPGARPMNPDWIRSIREQCKNAKVSFFFKQGSKDWGKDFKNIDSFPDDLKVREFPK